MVSWFSVRPKSLGSLCATDATLVEHHIQPIRLFATEIGFSKLDTMSEAEVVAQQQLIEPAVRQLFQHFLKQHVLTSKPVKRENLKVGRNDPCPCGSWKKKFKKCCLH